MWVSQVSAGKLYNEGGPLTLITPNKSWIVALVVETGVKFHTPAWQDNDPVSPPSDMWAMFDNVLMKVVALQPVSNPISSYFGWNANIGSGRLWAMSILFFISNNNVKHHLLVCAGHRSAEMISTLLHTIIANNPPVRWYSAKLGKHIFSDKYFEGILWLLSWGVEGRNQFDILTICFLEIC